MIADSNSFKVVEDWGRTRFVHTRDLGEGSSWADRVIHGVDLDDTCRWSLESTLIRQEQESSDKEKRYSMICERNIDPQIRESGSVLEKTKGSGDSKNRGYGTDPLVRKWVQKTFPSDNGKLNGKNKDFYRKRKIPLSRKKNFTVKPQRSVQKEKTESKEKKYEIVNGDDSEYHTIREEGDDVMYRSIEDDIIGVNEEDTHYDWNGCSIPYVFGEVGECTCVNDPNETNETNETSDYGEFPKFERAFVEVSREEKYVSKFNEVSDSYSYENAKDSYYPPYDTETGDRVEMWCPPDDWIVPTIYWDRIWSDMDFDRLGYRRAYTYTPEIGNSKAVIQFFNHNL